MTRGRGHGRRAVITGAALACVLMALLTPAAAFALAPHVATTPDPDSCAMCHRAHTAAADFGRVDPETWEMTSTALALAVPLAAGDTALCYVCHGIDALGSGTPVGAAFVEQSAHSLAPAASPFGPSVKYCSSCHDSHGADKAADGGAYPALLRARLENGDPVFQGSAYCGTCHQVRAESSFDGVAVYEQTAHFTMLPDPVSGAKIRCSICHTAHGSAIAPLIVSEIASPAVEATVTITENDRTFCFACHPETLGVYPGEDAYGQSAHAAAEAATTIPGEWPGNDAERLVGECQVCHAIMGRDDGTGAPIPALLEMDPTALCLTCHDADGPAATDLAALTYTGASASDLEILAGLVPDETTKSFGTLAVWGTVPGAAAPRPISGPRFYAPVGTSGAMAVGDIDGDGKQNAVVADSDFARITVFSPDSLKGLSSYVEPGVLVIDAIAEHMVVANVVGDAVPELCVISGSTLYVYRYDTLGVTQLLNMVAGLGADITGLAAGDLNGDGSAELVVTDAGAPEIHVLTESALTPGTLEPLISPIAAKAGVRGPSIGDIDAAAGIEIAVANADEATDQVTVYDAAGIELGSAALTGSGTARAWDTLVADVLPGSTPSGTSGAELSVAVNGAEDESFVYVFSQEPTGGIAMTEAHATGLGSGTGSLASGDVDGDTYDELVVGNGGFWSREAALATPPSVHVMQHNALRTGFDTALTQPLLVGGVERAGDAPALAVADLGGVGPSRHPVGAVEDSHVSTESAPFVRHVECADCHNSHEATSTPSPAAPAAYGRILGTFGATANLADAQPITKEYELCYKCHSAYQSAAGLEGSRDISALLDSGNASVHAVEESVTTTINAGTFESGWGNGAVLFCIDCHSVAEAAPAVAGPHSSVEAPILRSPYLGVVPADMDGLCYDCHRHAVYYTGADDTTVTTGSFFWDATAGPLHQLHVGEHGFGCAACHETHGSPINERLIRQAITYNETARSCTGPCHPVGITYTP